MSLSYSLQLLFPSPVFLSPRNTIEKRLGNLRTLHSSKEGGQQHTENDRSQDQVILLERYGNGTIKRFIP
ncbi:protein root UVB sensitive 5-like isoform X4 [Gossypium australe]|uniref:Protein root UVB sensitive 5-like isoform X4 n=1 Tax=Gossypium australe TaxID=47621 RepID=A0A5B6V3Q0_9ROSI|nr:protein root UVB sensitive 5-like isoform X4 [Gossypium australe]